LLFEPCSVCHIPDNELHWADESDPRNNRTLSKQKDGCRIKLKTYVRPKRQTGR
jgi:hypothetical protein